MAFVIWRDAYSVGVPEMDRQHQLLVDLINRLHDTVRDGRSSTAVGNVLAELLDYTRTHFADEERLMAEHGFESFREHKAKHDALARQVMEIQRSFQAGTAAFTAPVLSFLRAWLVTHIRGVDRLYGDCISGTRLAA